MIRCQGSSFGRVNVFSGEPALSLHLWRLVKCFMAQSVVTMLPIYIGVSLS